MTGWDAECVRRAGCGRSQSGYSRIAKVIRTKIVWIICLIVGRALDIARSTRSRSQIDSETSRCAAAVRKGVGLIIVGCGTGKAAAGTSFAATGAWRSVPTEAICLSQISCLQLAERNRLIGATGAGWHRIMDRFASTRVSQIEG